MIWLIFLFLSFGFISWCFSDSKDDKSLRILAFICELIIIFCFIVSFQGIKTRIRNEAIINYDRGKYKIETQVDTTYKVIKVKPLNPYK